MPDLIKPEMNKPAPDFTLPDPQGNRISLGDFQGKTVVLYFYPKAMTPGCTVQACGIRDQQQTYEKENIVVLGISPDPVKRLQKFVEKEKLNFTLLSDEDHAVADAYGVWGKKIYMGREFDGIHRVSFIIDEQGILRHVMEKVNTKTHHEDVLALIRKG